MEVAAAGKRTVPLGRRTRWWGMGAANAICLLFCMLPEVVGLC